MAHSTRQVLVYSAPFSGSTLLSLLVGSHPGAVALGEVIGLPHAFAADQACSCGQGARSCPYWTAVRRRLDDRTLASLALVARPPALPGRDATWARGPITRLRRMAMLAGAYLGLKGGGGPSSPLRAWHAGAVRASLAVFAAAREVSGRDVVVDISKSYIHASALYQAEPEGSKVIVLLRDGRGVFASGLSRGMSRRDAVNAWVRTLRRGISLVERIVPPQARLLLRYEELAGDPRAAVARVCEFVGLSFVEDMLDFRRHRHHLVTGNRMRLAGRGDISPDLSWQGALSPAELAFFCRRAGDLNRRLGYRDEPAEHA